MRFGQLYRETDTVAIGGIIMSHDTSMQNRGFNTMDTFFGYLNLFVQLTLRKESIESME